MTNQSVPGVQRTQECIGRWQHVLGMIQSAPPEMQNPVLIGLINLVMESDKKTLECIETGAPMVSTWYGNASEILAAMDIHFFNPVFNILGHMYMTELYDLEESDKISLPDDICSLIRLSTYAVQDHLVPKPTAMLAMLEPCDAQPVMHESFKHNGWANVPDFSLDYGYGTSEEDYQYFANELKGMITFLEAVHPGVKMDYDKLRAVIEETNRQYETWAEYNELRRAVPCPGGSFQGSVVAWPITQHVRAGQQKATELLQMMVYDAEQKVKAGIGAVPDEQIRILWADLAPQWNEELGQWLAEEWKANVVMDFQGYAPYTPIDTSTPESMLLGLARRSTAEVPMIRQARGTVEVFLEDITRIVKDYSIDCVIFPGHMGHKDQSATTKFLKELCKDLDVPLLSLTTSLFDERYTPMEEVKKQISEFFRVTGLSEK
ncbi:2-hydroxyacyl-CoA dehydratase family protein [Acetobacterium sp. KB-1]|uniref:2-hydroxyacyl-CoA dehydratase family protein n=1 Tax=Acetobacterium sp. KB-1 TaxID=2184575 RepID=UPI000DBEB967|nr:2-hydroxyacyl-CoA dehydratase family protein [Acetobacterium sp. KB-1]AWW25868.1 2-hydroxyacyl-CoA dehydratase [Acetobacterium sp. KB-1]